MSSKDDVELTELPGVAERSPAEKTMANRQDSSQVETPAAGTTKIPQQRESISPDMERVKTEASGNADTTPGTQEAKITREGHLGKG